MVPLLLVLKLYTVALQPNVSPGLSFYRKSVESFKVGTVSLVQLRRLARAVNLVVVIVSAAVSITCL